MRTLLINNAHKEYFFIKFPNEHSFSERSIIKALLDRANSDNKEIVMVVEKDSWFSPIARICFSYATYVVSTTGEILKNRYGSIPADFWEEFPDDFVIGVKKGCPLNYHLSNQCDCGKEKHNFFNHSDWCSVNNRGK